MKAKKLKKPKPITPTYVSRTVGNNLAYLQERGLIKPFDAGTVMMRAKNANTR